jgi:hypothetical protein
MANGFRLTLSGDFPVRVGTRVRNDGESASFSGAVTKVVRFGGEILATIELDAGASVLTFLDGIDLCNDGVWLFVPSDKYSVSSSVHGPVVVTRFYQTVFAEWSPGNATRYTAMANNVGHCGLSEGVGTVGLVSDGAILLTLGNNGVSYFVSHEDELDPVYVQEKWKVRGPDLAGATAVLVAAFERCRA